MVALYTDINAKVKTGKRGKNAADWEKSF